jgi:hypothetical protein
VTVSSAPNAATARRAAAAAAATARSRDSRGDDGGDANDDDDGGDRNDDDDDVDNVRDRVRMRIPTDPFDDACIGATSSPSPPSSSPPPPRLLLSRFGERGEIDLMALPRRDDDDDDDGNDDVEKCPRRDVCGDGDDSENWPFDSRRSRKSFLRCSACSFATCAVV